MTDFGDKLRQARERRGLSVRQIADRTKIGAATLEALERNDVRRLPGGIFSRGFVKSYAEEVGLDPDETVREFLELFGAEPSPAPRVVPIPEAESAFESQRRIAATVLTLVVASVVVAIAMAAFTFRTPSAPSPVPARSAEPRAPGPAAAPADRPLARAVPEKPALVAPAPAAPVAVRAGGFVLEVHPSGSCWVSLTIDGEPRLQRIVEAGERLRYGIETAAVIQVGDARAFEYSINGVPGRSLGGAGEVRSARITRDTLNDFIR
jgi:cytoskeleton protein RodZ